MTRLISRRSTEIQGPNSATTISKEYFRLRDFEYAQPLYDLAFLIEVDALAKGNEVPKFRTFSLWRAGYSLDGYGSTIDRWLEGTLRDEDLDYVPSARIRQYLTNIRLSGTVPELHSYRTEQYDRCLRLRSVRGLGPSKIAATLLPGSSADDWLHQSIAGLDVDPNRVTRLYHTSNAGPWQTAHIVPPLLRFLNKLQEHGLHTARWELSGISDPFKPVDGPLPEADTVERAGLKPGQVLLLRPNAVKGGALRLAANIVASTFQVFQDCGRGECECAVFWTGPAGNEIVDGLKHPIHERSPYGYHVDSNWLTEFWNELAASKRSVKVQVHTHPGKAFHSATDDRWPIIAQDGFLSIVIPDFAAGPPTLSRAWIGRLQASGNWQQLESAQEAVTIP